MKNTARSTRCLILVVLLLASGLVGSAERIINERSDQVTDPVQMGEVVFTSHEMNRTKTNEGIFADSKKTVIRLSVENAYMSENSAGFKTVTVLFRNHTDFDQFIEVRAQFYDESFRITESFSRWKRFFVPANATEIYDTIAIEKQTTQYRLEVRQSN